MEPEQNSSSPGLQLPVGVVSPGDLRRLKRDLDSLEDSLRQLRLQTNSPVAKLPRSSRALEEFAATNRLNLLLPDDRQRASAYLAHTIKVAPVVHMSFAAEASRAFTTQVVLWLRQNIRQDILVRIGLEPNLAAGCVLRTTNKRFDMSLRARFEGQADLLAEKMKAET